MNYDNLSDNEIIRLIKKGDSDAVTYLIVEYKWLVASVARNFFLTGMEEDILQEGNIGLSNAINTYDESKAASFKTYAGVCIKRAILDMLKKNKTSFQGVPIEIIEATDDSYEDGWMRGAKAREIRKKMLALLTTNQQLLLNYYLDGYSYSEIAALTDKSVKQVDNNIQRIKKRLRENLDIDDIITF